jgi:N-acetylated-alpha-linked acidic dipeptidase
MKKTILIAICTAVASTLCAQSSISGFSAATVAKQQQTEKQFDAGISAERIAQTVKELSAKPHHIGSAGGTEVAEKILNKFKSWGWDAKIETYQVLFPKPKTRLLEMIAPVPFKAVLKEPALKEDATSGQEDQLPTYNACLLFLGCRNIMHDSINSVLMCAEKL